MFLPGQKYLAKCSHNTILTKLTLRLRLALVKCSHNTIPTKLPLRLRLALVKCSGICSH